MLECRNRNWLIHSCIDAMPMDNVNKSLFHVKLNIKMQIVNWVFYSNRCVYLPSIQLEWCILLELAQQSHLDWIVGDPAYTRNVCDAKYSLDHSPSIDFSRTQNIIINLSKQMLLMWYFKNPTQKKQISWKQPKAIVK